MATLPSPPAHLAKPLEGGRGGGRPLPPHQRGPLKLDQGGGPNCWLLGEARVESSAPSPGPPGHPSIEGPAVLDQRCHENLLRQCVPRCVVPRARAGATRTWVLGPSLASVGPGALAPVWPLWGWPRGAPCPAPGGGPPDLWASAALGAELDRGDPHPKAPVPPGCLGRTERAWKPSPRVSRHLPPAPCASDR